MASPRGRPASVVEEVQCLCHEHAKEHKAQAKATIMREAGRTLGAITIAQALPSSDQAQAVIDAVLASALQSITDEPE